MCTRALWLLGFLAACASKDAPEEKGPEAAGDPRTRVLYRQFYQGSRPLVLENLAGRDLKVLRSKPVPAGEPPVAYCPDEDMRRMLKEFQRAGYHEYARSLPDDPSRFGIAELTLIDPSGRRMGFLRTRQPPGVPPDSFRKESQAYQDCLKSFLGTYHVHAPSFQVTTGKGDFGTHRVQK
jgi:hypothetical protein